MFEEKIAALNEQYEEKMALKINLSRRERTLLMRFRIFSASVSLPLIIWLSQDFFVMYVLAGLFVSRKKVLMNGWISNFDFGQGCR